MPKNNLSYKGIKKMGLAMGSAIVISAFVACGSSDKIVDQGVITKIKEVELDQFKITDEQLIAKKADSRIIATYLDGHVDTLSLDEAKLTEGQTTTTRRSGMNRILMGGMMGYMLGRNVSSPLNSNAYMNKSAYDKSNTASSKYKATARRNSVSKSRSGYGRSRSSGSSRSYGG